MNPKSLAERNLLRGWRMRLPSGQTIARAMGLKPLSDDEIRIGKFSDDEADILGPVTKFGSAFAGNCPLWTYVLAETVEVDVPLKSSKGKMKIKSRKLGPIGGRTVAETIVGLIFHDSQSFVSQGRPRVHFANFRTVIARARSTLACIKPVSPVRSDSLGGTSHRNLT